MRPRQQPHEREQIPREQIHERPEQAPLPRPTARARNLTGRAADEFANPTGLPRICATASSAGFKSVSVGTIMPTSYSPRTAIVTKSIASATSMPFSSSFSWGQLRG
jgi:hypothetical protein